MLVAFAAMTLDVIGGLGSQRFDQHPPCALAHDLVQQLKLRSCFPVIPLVDYLQHRWRLPTKPGSHRVWAFAYAEGCAACFMRASHPQPSVIAQLGARGRSGSHRAAHHLAPIPGSFARRFVVIPE